MAISHAGISALNLCTEVLMDRRKNRHFHVFRRGNHLSAFRPGLVKYYHTGKSSGQFSPIERLVNKRKSVISKIIGFLTALVFVAIVTLNFLPDALAGIPDRVAQLNKSDVIIVLGTPSESDGCASPVMRERVLAGVDLLKKKFASHIIFTGAAAHNNFVEADVMSDLAKANGVAPDQIVCERDARNTAQNAFNSVEIMRKHGWKSATVVTSVAHARRACHILSHYRIKYCISTCQEPADQPVYKRFVFDQREKLLLLGDLLTKQSMSFGLTAKQESKLKQMQATPETN